MPDVSPAELASQEALDAMQLCLDTGRSFRLEAGAGAGKTYSLVRALHYLIERDRRMLERRRQSIACITFTNVARDEIIARTDRSPVVFCETNHAFCWSLIRPFQKQLRNLVGDMEAWTERIDEAGGDIGDRAVEYTLGHRAIKADSVLLGHDDILPLTVALMEHTKFRRIMAARHPIILIDEYQDTNSQWMDGICRLLLGHEGAPLLGFFGDHWQRIYDDGCGLFEHPAVIVIPKEANFRSVATVVDCLNRMRPELPQDVVDPASLGTVDVFHSNDWTGERRDRNWKGDLPENASQIAFEWVRSRLEEAGWDFDDGSTKVLMLTHKLLGAEQGYASLGDVFRDNEDFAKKKHPHIGFFVDRIEPACDAFVENRFGAMFEALGATVPLVHRASDKRAWHEAMNRLIQLREGGTVGDVVDHLASTQRPGLPDSVARRERELGEFDETSGEEMPRRLTELRNLRSVEYAEIKALRAYLDGHSPFETKHGVKGAEFDNVLIVVGRGGWTKYNFDKMLTLARLDTIPAKEQSLYERTRNLFYVVCSRPRKRLALLFTQELSPEAMSTLKAWFLPDNVHAVTFSR